VKRRAYDSDSRRAGAERTRQRILEAARRLFAKDGFDKVTIAHLAAEAEVAQPTIYAVFQSKSGVLEALLRETLFGERYRELVEAALASDDSRERIRMAARIARTVFDGERREADTIRGAAALSRELKALEKRRERQRFEGQEPTIALLFEQRRFARDLDVRRARDLLWALTGRDLYRLLVIERGWSPDEYEEWLADLLERTLVRD
jgi:AcrR family transcriptional regulator